MARDEHEKPVGLRPVDDPPPADEVIRLKTGGSRGKNRKAGRGDPAEKDPAQAANNPPDRAGQETIQRLEPAERVERHAPEAREPSGNKGAMLISAAPVLEATEDVWGRPSGMKRPIPWGLFVVAGLIALGALFWTFRDARTVARENTRDRQAETEALEAAAKLQSEAEGLVDSINHTLAAFTAAITLDEMMTLVRHPDRVRPLMEEYYAEKQISPTSVERIWLAPQNLSGRTNFWIANFRSEAGEDRVLVEIGDDGEVKIDWETHVGYQPMDWEHYVFERPEGSYDFRVYAVPDDFHSHEFRDSSQWFCFRLSALHSQENLFGYARRNSPAGKRMVEELAKSAGNPATLILRLGIPPDLKSPDGVVIEQVVSPYWILLDDPDSNP